MIKKSYSFNDLWLVPQYSEVETRANVNLSVSIREFTYQHPVIPANMATISGYDMCNLNVKLKGLSIAHRFQTHEDQLNIFKKLTQQNNLINVSNYFAISVGVKAEEMSLVKQFMDSDGKIICIDIAHGDSKLCVDMIRRIKSDYPDCLLIAGNVATKHGAMRLWNNGADVVKSGIGAGGLCTTRITTGNGVPMMTCLMDCYTNKPNNKYLISDGGIKYIGDFTKALCFSDMVMAGSIFSGTDETPGETIYENGKRYKTYAGSSTYKNRKEGVVVLVEAKGPATNVFNSIFQGIESGCSYQGVDNLEALKIDPEFVESSFSGYIEATPHTSGLIK